MLNQRQIKNYEVATLAELKLLNGRNREICFCTENQSFYRFDENGGSYTANDTTIITTLHGGNTRWLAIAGKYNLNGGGSGSSEYVSLDVNQAAHGFNNDFVYNNGTTWVKAIADDSATLATHFAIRIDDDNFKLIIIGEVDSTGMTDDQNNPLVNGTYYFLSDTVAGKITSTAPTIAQGVLKKNTGTNATVSIEIAFSIAEIEGAAFKGEDNVFTGTNTFEKEIVLKNIATPTTPSAGYIKTYSKNSKLYSVNEDGEEVEFTTSEIQENILDVTDILLLDNMSASTIVIKNYYGGNAIVRLPNTSTIFVGKTYKIVYADANVSTHKITIQTSTGITIGDMHWYTGVEFVCISTADNSYSSWRRMLGNETDSSFGQFVDSLSGKDTPVDADTLPISDSASSKYAKKISWNILKTTLKTYFDTLYQSILVSGTNIKTINSQSILGSGNLTIGGTTSSLKATFSVEPSNSVNKDCGVEVMPNGKIGTAYKQLSYNYASIIGSGVQGQILDVCYLDDAYGLIVCKESVFSYGLSVRCFTHTSSSFNVGTAINITDGTTSIIHANLIRQSGTQAAIVFHNETSSYIGAYIITRTSGTTITSAYFTSRTSTFHSDTVNTLPVVSSYMDGSNTKNIIYYKDAMNSNYGTGLVLNWNGTNTLTFGVKFVVAGTVPYNPTLSITSNNKILFGYGSQDGNTSYHYINICTVAADNSLSVVSNSFNLIPSFSFRGAVALSDDRFVYFGTRKDYSPYEKHLSAIVFKFDSTYNVLKQIGSSYFDIDEYSTKEFSLSNYTKLDSNTFALFRYNYGKVSLFKLTDDNEIIIENTLSFNYNSHSVNFRFPVLCKLIDTSRFAIVGIVNGGGGIYCGICSYRKRNRYLGISEQTSSTTASVVIGGKIEGISSTLIVGNKYYLQDNGSIGTAVTDIFLGIADTTSSITPTKE